MFNAGLSLDQAPPLGAVLRFFLTLPLFGFIAAVCMIASYTDLGNTGTPAFLALTHLVVLGIAAQAMSGALFQMLPVLAGAVIDHPYRRARRIHALLTLGSVSLVFAFASERFDLLGIAAPLTAAALGFMAVVMLNRLLRVANKTASVTGMILALVALLGALIAALAMGFFYATGDLGSLFSAFKAAHIRLMLLGWILTLIVAVALQVVEMFYVTPPYPKAVQRFFLPLLFILLIADTAGAFLLPSAVPAIDTLLALTVTAFAALTLRRLSQRKRPLADATVWLWRTGMGVLLLAAVLFLAGETVAAAYALGYAILSVIYAMSYKIVPFLVWFHLNAKGVMECPMMGDVVPARRARYHLQLFWAAGVFLAAAPFAAETLIAAGMLFGMLNLLYGYNLLHAAVLYFKLKDKGIL